MRILILLSLVISFLTVAVAAETPAQPQISDYSFGMSYGRGVRAIDFEGIRFSRDWNTLIGSSSTFRLTGYWEINATLWNQEFSQALDVGFNPVFRFEKANATTYFFFDISFGPHYLSTQYLENRDMGSNFQFGDYFGFGMGLDPQRNIEIGLRYMHYSNANLFGSVNPGANIAALTATFKMN